MLVVWYCSPGQLGHFESLSLCVCVWETLSPQQCRHTHSRCLWVNPRSLHQDPGERPDMAPQWPGGGRGLRGSGSCLPSMTCLQGTASRGRDIFPDPWALQQQEAAQIDELPDTILLCMISLSLSPTGTYLRGHFFLNQNVQMFTDKSHNLHVYFVNTWSFLHAIKP